LSKVPQAIQPRILLTGFHDQLGGASREVLAALYNAADVYVSTSAEGFGLTIAEAMACGTPAVGIDYSAVPEVIGAGGRVVAAPLPIDNEYDHFWAGVDEVAFGRTVGALLDDDLTRAQMGKAAAERVRALFRWDIAAQQFSALFVEALA
jgi:glycosyltransferase involved in cell wall biosynthesis